MSDVAAPKLLSYGHQCLDDDDRKAVLDVLHGDWLTQGPLVRQFESALCALTKANHAVVANSGTSALHLIARAMGWGEGDVVLVPAMTFLATANCCLYVGAEPYFVDIDPVSLTIDPNDVERRVRQLRARGLKVRAVIGMDMAGHPCDWKALREIADRFDLELIADACHSIGSRYGETLTGSCVDYTAAALSFHAVKHVTTAEGGAVLTNDVEIATKVADLRSHGILRGQAKVSGWEGPWHFDMAELGYNYRLSDLQCALGISQVRKINSFVERRRSIAATYRELLASAEHLRLPIEKPGFYHSYHLYVVQVDFEACGVDRRELFDRCRDLQILLQVHYRPVVLNSFYRSRPINDGAVSRLPVSMAYYRRAVSLPIYPQLDQADLERVNDALRSSLR